MHVRESSSCSEQEQWEIWVAPSLPAPASLGGQLGVSEMGPTVVYMGGSVSLKAWAAEWHFCTPHMLRSLYWPILSIAVVVLVTSASVHYYLLMSEWCRITFQHPAWNTCCPSEATSLDENWPDLMAVWTVSSSENWMRWIFSTRIINSQTLQGKMRLLCLTAHPELNGAFGVQRMSNFCYRSDFLESSLNWCELS